MIQFMKKTLFFWHIPTNRLLFVGIGMCAFFLLTGCTQLPSQSSSHTNASSHIVTMDASWPKQYHALKELKNDTDLVVRGKIMGIASTSKPVNAPISTYFTFSVEKVLWNPHTITVGSGSALMLHQAGGLDQGTLYQVGDDPLFTAGEELILFLHQYNPGQYFVIGGPSGRFEVRTGSVTPVNNESISLPSNTDENGFEKLLASA